MFRLSTVVCLLAGGGCLIAIDDDMVSLGSTDLEVRWTIEARSDAAACYRFGIHSWSIEVLGPERRRVDLDCEKHWWSSEADLYDLLPGDYAVKITAVDQLGQSITEGRTQVHLRASDLRPLSFTFHESEFL